MITKVFALVTTALIGALALEMVFGVHLGIAAWMRAVLDPTRLDGASF